jgi:hypothetical protein
MSIELYYFTDNYNKNYICFPFGQPGGCIDLRDFLNSDINEAELYYTNMSIKYFFLKKYNNMTITIIKNNINISQINYNLDDRNIYYFNEFSINLYQYYVNSMMNGLNL